MSARQSVYVVKDAACDGGESPNAFVPKITVELRVFFPPNTVTDDEVLGVLDAAYTEAFDGTMAFFKERGE